MSVASLFDYLLVVQWSLSQAGNDGSLILFANPDEHRIILLATYRLVVSVMSKS